MKIMKIKIQCALCHMEMGTKKSEKWVIVSDPVIDSICATCYRTILQADSKGKSDQPSSEILC
jgi:hypothetical protein